MDSKKCEAFLAAIDYGSLTAAGDALGYTQPGITRMINTLEEELGFKLFVRTKKGVSVTPNGEIMIPAFREIVRAQRVAEELGSNIQGMLSGVLTIAAYYSISAGWLPAIIQRFQKDYPYVIIRVNEGGNREIAQWLHDKSVDLSFAAQPSEKVPCDWIPLVQDEMEVWLPIDHPAAKAASFPIEQLNGAPFIMTSANQDTEIDRLLAKELLVPDIKFSTKDSFTTYCMVEAGLGISMNNHLISQKWSGQVKQLPFNPPHYVELGLAVPNLEEASPATKVFIDYVKSFLETIK
ncbi:LysR family transcriptional regulator [Veillonella montpellierensis]|uniref:LysR family transcriptional regulator n=1 Tax=Veillonella montpellierensis TaxID=187328 RepID=UPI0023F62704|nr:LysR family transcriptional regulator [Veillonella montpellierensis]